MLAYVDCFSGVSGDMLLGALLDAGVSLDLLLEQLGRLGLPGWRLEVSERSDQGILGTQVNVVLSDAKQASRRLPEIERLLADSALEPEVARRALDVFERLARAEAAVHGVPPEEVHFHEVGAVDALVDVVGTVAGLRLLGVEQLFASALPLGGGATRSRHGVIPLPAPGTLEILAEAGAPTRPVPTDRELVTPTGAALVCELATFQQPPMTIRRVGYGFGRARFDWPNCLRLWLGEPVPTWIGREEVSLLEANLDDMSPELLGFAMEQLFAAGALDVYFQPLQMKKNRPAVLLGVLCRPAQVAQLADVVLAETTTLGVRVSQLERYIADRSTATVQTALGPLQVKVKRVGERRVIAPEYEDAARLARERQVPLAEVYRQAAKAELAPDDNAGTS